MMLVLQWFTNISLGYVKWLIFLAPCVIITVQDQDTRSHLNNLFNFKE